MFFSEKISTQLGETSSPWCLLIVAAHKGDLNGLVLTALFFLEEPTLTATMTQSMAGTSGSHGDLWLSSFPLKKNRLIFMGFSSIFTPLAYSPQGPVLVSQLKWNRGAEWRELTWTCWDDCPDSAYIIRMNLKSTKYCVFLGHFMWLRFLLIRDFYNPLWESILSTSQDVMGWWDLLLNCVS